MLKTEHTRAEPLFLDGNALLDQGRHAEAEVCFREALSLAPNFAEAHGNLALTLEKRGNLPLAEAHYLRALALAPERATVWLNFAMMLAAGKRLAEAEVLCARAVSLQPGSPAAWSNLGVVLARLKREEEAEQCQRTALSLDPEQASARFNLAYLLLRQGRFGEGWACLEARDWIPALEGRLPCPRWQGGPPRGLQILMVAEGGHGDAIQFCRYGRALKEAGAAWIGLACHPALVSLMRSAHEVDQVYSLAEAFPAWPLPPSARWDGWVPLMSLPHLLDTRLDTIPAAVPYLQAPPARTAFWAKALPPGQPRVGLAWKGNPAFENDAERSLPSLASLLPLAAIPGTRFVSLQKGGGEDEARHPPAGLTILPLGERLKDFADTAALIACLDLVISVDTAVAHLAGALGTPCWLLLPDYQTDWRWLKSRSDTPWYPGMRLFRQPPGGNWEPVIRAVRTALSEPSGAWSTASRAP